MGNMKKINLVLMAGLVLLNSVVMAADEKILGNVIAVERNFGAPSFSACKESFEIYISGQEYGCTVQLLKEVPYEQLIATTQSFGYGGLCSLEMITTNIGYRMKVLKLSLSGPSFSKADAIKCAEAVFISSGWVKKEMISTVFTVR
jgi:hypothetical protein